LINDGVWLLLLLVDNFFAGSGVCVDVSVVVAVFLHRERVIVVVVMMVRMIVKVGMAWVIFLWLLDSFFASLFFSVFFF